MTALVFNQTEENLPVADVFIQNTMPIDFILHKRHLKLWNEIMERVGCALNESLPHYIYCSGCRASTMWVLHPTFRSLHSGVVFLFWGFQWLRFSLLSFHKYMYIIYTVFWGRFKFTHVQCVSVLAQRSHFSQTTFHMCLLSSKEGKLFCCNDFPPWANTAGHCPRHDTGAGLGLLSWLVAHPLGHSGAIRALRRVTLCWWLLFMCWNIQADLHIKRFIQTLCANLHSQTEAQKHNTHQNIFWITAKLLSN